MVCPMIALAGRAVATHLERQLDRAVWLLVDRASLTSMRHNRAYVLDHGEEPPKGFELLIGRADLSELPDGERFIQLPDSLSYLQGGDVISLDERGERIRVLWRHASPHNSVLLTERCDHFCLMCSQPPKERNDDHLLENAFELIRLLPRTTTSIGFTGGEPTLYGQRFLELMKLCRNLLPFAGVHILSNGRRFEDSVFSQQYAEIQNPNMMVGIPLYGAQAALHDYVVQAQGAFDGTLRGILNLGQLRQRIEIRVVIHKQTAPYLVDIAEFIARNLTFVEQVALMGLEPTGFARANLDDVWIDPIDYREELTEAVRRLDRRRVRTLVYNHQLCLIDREVWPFAVRSISDWKNEYHPECLQCSVIDQCGGFFFSARHRMSDHISAVQADEPQHALLPLASTSG
jgi:His-Xaa-Ser system radical SAM maturase HxsC